jgi:hypothetical protein
VGRRAIESLREAIEDGDPEVVLRAGRILKRIEERERRARRAAEGK